MSVSVSLIKLDGTKHPTWDSSGGIAGDKKIYDLLIECPSETHVFGKDDELAGHVSRPIDFNLCRSHLSPDRPNPNRFFGDAGYIRKRS